MGIVVVGLSREIALKENRSSFASHCQVMQGIRVQGMKHTLDTLFRVTLYAQVPSCTRVYSLLRTRT